MEFSTTNTVDRNEFFRLKFRTLQMGQQPSRCCSTSSLVEWEVADHEVTRRSVNYRKRLEKTWKDLGFREIVSDIQQFYLVLDVKMRKLLVEKDCELILKFFQEAYDNNDARPITTAYTSGTKFYEIVNTDLAKMVSTDNLRDIGMSLDAPQDRCYWEGSLDIACIFVNHPQFDCDKIREEMTVFRGIVVSKEILKKYLPGTRVMNKTFLSTSKLRRVAEFFINTSPDTFSCLFIITLVPSERRTAIDIEKLSIFSDEHEVLILPYATFLVQDVEVNTSTSMKRCTIKLREYHDVIDID